MKNGDVKKVAERLAAENDSIMQGWQKDFNDERVDQYQKTKKDLEIIIKYSENPPTTREELRELLSVLCWDNLGYCCSIPKKRCSYRTLVMAILGIEPREYTKRKDELGNEFQDRILKEKRIKESKP